MRKDQEDVTCKNCNKFDATKKLCGHYGTPTEANQFWSSCYGFEVKKVLLVPLPLPKKKRTNRKTKRVSKTG